MVSIAENAAYEATRRDLTGEQARTRIGELDHPRQVTVMLGAVCHDLGKPATTALIDGRIRSLDHEEQGVAPAAAFLDRLNLHSLGGFEGEARRRNRATERTTPSITRR